MKSLFTSPTNALTLLAGLTYVHSSYNQAHSSSTPLGNASFFFTVGAIASATDHPKAAQVANVIGLGNLAISALHGRKSKRDAISPAEALFGYIPETCLSFTAAICSSFMSHTPG
tara:strand:- start:613 stop:957 length:345 start_codon:yes stop_codon:yes gene_type:complete